MARYLQKSEVAISPDDRGFLFADGIYNVIRVYRGKLFKCAEHLERMARGLRNSRSTAAIQPHLSRSPIAS